LPLGGAENLGENTPGSQTIVTLELLKQISPNLKYLAGMELPTALEMFVRNMQGI